MKSYCGQGEGRYQAGQKSLIHQVKDYHLGCHESIRSGSGVTRPSMIRLLTLLSFTQGMGEMGMGWGFSRKGVQG